MPCNHASSTHDVMMLSRPQNWLYADCTSTAKLALLSATMMAQASAGPGRRVVAGSQPAWQCTCRQCPPAQRPGCYRLMCPEVNTRQHRCKIAKCIWFQQHNIRTCILYSKSCAESHIGQQTRTVQQEQQSCDTIQPPDIRRVRA